jgi:patatin-like phospholipase/acyl hydrolase
MTTALEEEHLHHGLRLLSLDGGGVRGISSLMILQRLMEAIDPKDPPKPCDCFDLIGGTSTGGLIAIMLGRMKLSVSQCIDAYSKLAPDAFTKLRHRVNIRGDTQGRFDHVALEKGMRALLRKYRFGEDALLSDEDDKSSCKV